MRTKYIEEDGKKFLIVQVNHNLDYGFISKTGKSFVFRVRGTYLKNNGEIIGKPDTLTGYIHNPLPEPVVPMRRQHYHQSNIEKIQFEKDLILPAVKIHIQK